jgi:hypothetical protein
MHSSTGFLYTLDGGRVLLDWQRGYSLGLRAAQLSLLSVVQDLWRVGEGASDSPFVPERA